MLIYFGVILLIFILYFCWRGSYWYRRNVDGPRGLPIVGNMIDYILGRKHYGEVYQDIYNAYPNAKFVGIYTLLNQPSIIIRDLDLVKKVLVKNFSSFHDNFFLVDKDSDPLASNNPFAAQGDNWKTLRNQIAPIFTLHKIKLSFPYILEACGKLEKYIAKGPNTRINAFEAKDLCSKYTLEVVASCAFGLEGNTFTDEDSDFVRLCDKLFAPNFWSIFHTTAILFLPFIGKLFGLPFIPKQAQNWIKVIVQEVSNRRAETNEERSDFLQAILDLKKKDSSIDNVTIAGHASTFILEGFETSSTLMAFCLYELATNLNIQSKVHDEIDKVLSKNNWDINYETLQKMQYVDCVILETLRMHPAMLALTKICTERFELPEQYENSKRAFIEPGTCVILPVSGIHMDADIYTAPNEFQPDRFRDENSFLRNKYAYLAFGEGPRMCVGMKFGLAQSKAGLVTILSKFTTRLSPKTKVPPTVSPTTFLLSASDGIWINFERRLRKFSREF